MKIQRTNRTLDLWVHIDGLIQIHRVCVCVCASVCACESISPIRGMMCFRISVWYTRYRTDVSALDSFFYWFKLLFLFVKSLTHESKHLSGTRLILTYYFWSNFIFHYLLSKWEKKNCQSENEKYTHTHISDTEWVAEPWTMRRFFFFLSLNWEFACITFVCYL